MGVKIMVTGVVQGVGFRPLVYSLAIKHNAYGYVQNTPEGVKILLDVDMSTANNFITELYASLPAIAEIKSLDISNVILDKAYNNFEILSSIQGDGIADIPADTAICDKCLDDIFNFSSRYYLYPYTSCMHCGPRYSAIESLPYDRDKTVYSDFALCNDCNDAYTDPLNRRFHAQTVIPPLLVALKNTFISR